MEEFFERQMHVAAGLGEKADAADAEESIRMGQGQTPVADPSVYNPKELRDNGYPLSNPTMEPNRHTKPNARHYAGRDSANGQPITPVTMMPKNQLPATQIFTSRVAPAYTGLANSQNSFDVENNISKVFQEVIGYTNSLSEIDPEIAGVQANRVKWAASDRLEQLGFDLIFQSERNEEGINDKGLNGLQVVMSAHIMRGAESFEEVTGLIGDTGANADQLEETWNKAKQAYMRAGLGVQQVMPSNKEQAMEDHRYLGASAIVQDAMFGASKDMSAEELYESGMSNIDWIKNNELYLLDMVMKAKDSPQLAEAINFLLDAEDNMDTTAADVGRAAMGIVTSPSSYIGLGLGAKLLSGPVKGTAVREILKKFAVTGAEGAALTGAYSGLTDYGYQNLDIQAGKQEEFDPVRSAVTTGAYAGVGALFGGVLGLAPEAARATTKWFKGFQKKNAATESKYLDLSDPLYNVEQIGKSAREDFTGIPDPLDESLTARRAAKDAKDQPDLDASLNPEEDGMTLGYTDDGTEVIKAKKEPLPKVSTTMETRRRMRENDKLIIQAREEVPGDIIDFIDDMLDVPGARSSKEVRDDITQIINEMVENPDKYGLTDLDYIKFEQIRDVMMEDSQSFLQLVDQRRRDSVVVLPGGQTEKSKGSAQLEGVPTKKQELANKKKADAKFYKEMGESIDANTAEADKKIRDAFEPFDRYDRADPVNSDLMQIAIDKDPKLAANVERAIMGEELVKPFYDKKPSFLKGRIKELQGRLDEYKQLIETAGSDTFKGKELRFFAEMLEKELANRK